MAVSQPFPAMYGGVCGNPTCRTPIRPDDMVRYVGEKTLVHDECTVRGQADDGEWPFAQPSEPQIQVTRRVQPKVCPSCFIAHAGECF